MEDINAQMENSSHFDFHMPWTPEMEQVSHDLIQSAQLEQPLRKTLPVNTPNPFHSPQPLAALTLVSCPDIQDPIRKIQTFSSLLLAKEELSETGKDYFVRMQTAAKKLQQAIDSLRDLSEIESDRTPFSNTDLRGVTEDTMEKMQKTICSYKAVISVRGTGRAFVVKERFAQMIREIILNGLKFSSARKRPHLSMSFGTGKGKYYLRPQLDQTIDYCHIRIKDNGIGFDPQFNERIFEVFQKLNCQDEYPGLGMGLAICKRICERHRGFIFAHGESGKGTCIDIYLPAR
jgi:signal transduction histidine kinase